MGVESSVSDAVAVDADDDVWFVRSSVAAADGNFPPCTTPAS